LLAAWQFICDESGAAAGGAPGRGRAGGRPVAARRPGSRIAPIIAIMRHNYFSFERARAAAVRSLAAPIRLSKFESN